MRVGRQEPSRHRIIEPAVHMDQPHIIQHLVPGIAVVHVRVVQEAIRVGRAVRVAALAPRVIRQALGDRSGSVGDRDDAAEVVLAVVLQTGAGNRYPVGLCDGDVFAEHHPARVQVVLVLHRAGQGVIGRDVFFLEMQAGVVSGAQDDDDRLIRLQFLDALVFGVVPELGRLGSIRGLAGNLVGNVEAGPDGGAPRPGGHVAVGVVGVGGVDRAVDGAGDLADGVRADAACAANAKFPPAFKGSSRVDC